ncbi:MAG: T9SS type A sorting domain-containing protein, partial [Ignavibacteriae bacterium]|nr:T9SS type A sorting domain-containing protein [Ignavibacteria bacterium]MBI3365936.1 T9SS type A sorting domain-containing protein [Ignavibacteriota bacterium]
VSHSFALNANYPNPFNPSTLISYNLPEESNAHLVVYNLLGQQVATLVDGLQSAGEHSVTFDASGLSSGLYYYKLEAGKNVQVNKMMLLK